MDGVLNLRKAAGPTSHDLVDRVRRIFDQKRVGHAGTLDPMATGVLVICLGKATRIVEYLTGSDKEYHATMTLGLSTDTQDSTGSVTTESDASGITAEDIAAAARRFVGEIEQVPPMISALKHEGKPLYKHAREGKIIERAPRKVTIYSIEVPGFIPGSRAEADMTVRCSSGTYIRTLCADIGDALGCGGMMSRLERTRVGAFSLDTSVTLEQLEEAQAQGSLEQHIASISEALSDMPAVAIDSEAEWRILHGLSSEVACDLPSGSTVKLLVDGRLVAIGTIDDSDGSKVARPKKVLVDPAEQLSA